MNIPTDPVWEQMKGRWAKYRIASSVRTRTPEQCAWDCAVLAASEFIRRVTRDEGLAFRLHAMLSVAPTQQFDPPDEPQPKVK